MTKRKTRRRMIITSSENKLHCTCARTTVMTTASIFREQKKCCDFFTICGRLDTRFERAQAGLVLYISQFSHLAPRTLYIRLISMSLFQTSSFWHIHSTFRPRGGSVFYDKAEIWIWSKKFIKLRLWSTGRLLKLKVSTPCFSLGGLDTL